MTADGRGRHDARARPGGEADSPAQIPAAGWRDIGRRALASIRKDQLPVISASMAFYALLAMFPALIAALSLYGLFADPQRVEQQIAEVADLLPPDAAELITQQLQTVAGAAGGALGLGVLVGILAALWTASSGMQGLMAGLTIAYDERESRGFVKRRTVALALTLVAIVLALLGLAVIAAVPAAMAAIGAEGPLRAVLFVVPWALLGLFVVGALSVIYRHGPDRQRRPRWRWVTPGAVAAAALWLVASIGFQIYVTRFGDFNETYGALGGVIILLLWLFISSFTVLLGAEIDAEAERQTTRRTTIDVTDPAARSTAQRADPRT